MLTSNCLQVKYGFERRSARDFDEKLGIRAGNIDHSLTQRPASAKTNGIHERRRVIITIMPSLKTSGRFSRAVAFAAVLFLFAACRGEKVILLEPKEDDLVVLNGCVISACNYLALVKTKHTLEPNFWTKILLVRYADHPAGHAYCVWETEGTIYGYDRNSGGFPIPVYTKDPQAIAIVLARELSKVLKEQLSVKSAEFVEPGESQLYKYVDAPTTNPALKLAARTALIPR